MTRTIIGPRAARPDVAPVGTKFYDQQSGITYTFGEHGWDDPTAKAETPKASVKAPEVKAEAPKPVKTTKAKKTVVEE